MLFKKICGGTSLIFMFFKLLISLNGFDGSICHKETKHNKKNTWTEKETKPRMRLILSLVFMSFSRAEWRSEHQTKYLHSVVLFNVYYMYPIDGASESFQCATATRTYSWNTSDLSLGWYECHVLLKSFIISDLLFKPRKSVEGDHFVS